MHTYVKFVVLEEFGAAIDWRGVIDPSLDVLILHHEAAPSPYRVIRLLRLNPQVLIRYDRLLDAYIGLSFGGCLGEGRPVKRGGLLVQLEEVSVTSNIDICRVVFVKVAIICDDLVASRVLVRSVIELTGYIVCESRLNGLISWLDQPVSFNDLDGIQFSIRAALAQEKLPIGINASVSLSQTHRARILAVDGWEINLEVECVVPHLVLC